MQIEQYVGDKAQFLSPDDSISLSLEFYQIFLDKTSASENKHRPAIFTGNSESEHKLKTVNESTLKNSDLNNLSSAAVKSDASCEQENSELNKNKINVVEDTNACSVDQKENKNCDKRFLQCPAAVSMRHLQKFVRMKYGLTVDHRVSQNINFIFLCY